MIEKSSVASDDAPAGGRAEDLSINNNLLNRIFTRVALKTLAKFHKSDGFCSPISRRLIIKTGPWVDLTEAATMKFIKENTSIPVPKVYCSFMHKSRTYILMERIKGEELPDAWERLGHEGRSKIFIQLKQMIEQMRALEPPPAIGVQSCTGGSLYDSRMNRPENRFGPFATIQKFHLWLRKGFRLAEHPNPEKLDNQEMQDLADMEALQDGQWPRPVFTHADLNPCNILVRGDKLVGIIDWEFAGWYPHYWEYTSAWFGNLVRTEWQDTLSRFLEQHPTEFAMETTRNRWWGEF